MTTRRNSNLLLHEAYFILHGWLRSGNTAAGRGAVEFLREALAKLPNLGWIRVVRADAGFFDQALLAYLEAQGLSYIVVARLTRWLKQEAARVREWRALDAVYAVAEFRLQLWGWNRARRFVVVREQLRETKGSLGKKLFEVPGYTFRLFVNNRADPPEEIWRDYNQRACIEQRIEELKSDLAADDFCLKQFYATEVAFLSILMLFVRHIGTGIQATGPESVQPLVKVVHPCFLSRASPERVGREVRSPSIPYGTSYTKRICSQTPRPGACRK